MKLKVQKKARYGDCTNQEAHSNIRFRSLMTTSTHSCEYAKEKEPEEA